MTTYTVKRDFPHGGEIHRKNGTITLSDRQARHLRLGGFIEPVKPVSKTTSKSSARTKRQGAKD